MCKGQNVPPTGRNSLCADIVINSRVGLTRDKVSKTLITSTIYTGGCGNVSVLSVCQRVGSGREQLTGQTMEF